jgi:hypothetical protein
MDQGTTLHTPACQDVAVAARDGKQHHALDVHQEQVRHGPSEGFRMMN